MNISIIGMPSSGKTTVAIELNKILSDYKLIDTDEIIIQTEKKSINKIFEENGEKYFRILESKILEAILNNDNQIISTGGGIVKSDENINLLKKKSVVIYLKTDINTLVERAKINNERPLLNNCNIKEKLENLLLNRKNNYEKAHYIIETYSKSPKKIAKEIMEILNEYNRS